jgi:Allene oxide cyclase barrel like domain
MRKTLRLGAVLAALLVLSGLTVTSASSTDKGSSHRDGRFVEVLHLTSTTVQETPSPDEEELPAVGDQFAFSDDLFFRGKKVGILGGQGVFVRVDEEAQAATVQIVITAMLPKGQITLQGLITFSEEAAGEPFRLAITGGTGRYNTAHGEVFVTETEDEDTVLLKLVIIH